ncbi:aggrecan core protein-like [Mytilus trossulus]|uniref:aggrecan core protein-like n=1 Tax=Mytilus trossulus TaxID=6551 RepID=UPI00300418A2
MILVFVSFLFGFVQQAVYGADLSHCPSRIRSLRYVHEYLDSCILFVRDKKSWTDGRANCRRLGGDLVMVKDASKQAVLLNYLRLDHWDTDNIWIGATDQQREGDWRWVDGSKISYSRFADGQGNNHNSGFLFANGGNEDCALIRRDDGGHWHDYPCQPIFGAFGYTYSYACEFPKIKMATTTMSSSTMKTMSSFKTVPTTTWSSVETPAPTTMPKAETPAPTTTMANVETPAPTTMPKAETPAPTTTMANVETPAPTTTMANVETPAPTTTMANVETPAPTTMPKAETPAPTTTMANMETPAPTTHLPNIETPAPTTAQPNKETPSSTLPPPTAIIGRRRRR